MRHFSAIAVLVGLFLVPSSLLGASTGDITINIADFAGNGIAPGTHVRGDLWGVSRPKGGGGWTWHYMPKPAVAAGSGSAVTWTQTEIDAQVDLTNNDFWFAVTGWGGSPSANTQIDSLDGLWSAFVPYDASLPAQTWDLRVSPASVYQASVTPTGLAYDLDLQGLSPPAVWSSAYISYEGCAHDSQPVVTAFTKSWLESQGYIFDEGLLASNGLLRVYNPSLGFDETVSARSDNAGGYIVELEKVGSGITTYDAGSKTLSVDLDFAAMGLAPGDHYYNQIGFVIEENISPDYLANGYQIDSWFTSGYFGSVLDAQVVPTPVPEPLTMVALIGGVSGLAGYVRRRRRA